MKYVVLTLLSALTMFLNIQVSWADSQWGHGFGSSREGAWAKAMIDGMRQMPSGAQSVSTGSSDCTQLTAGWSCDIEFTYEPTFVSHAEDNGSPDFDSEPDPCAADPDAEMAPC